MKEETVAYAGAVLGTPPGPIYQLVERIGEGGAGSVQRAREVGRTFTREVCIKRLSIVTPATCDALREEARLLARVRHANVVSLFAVGEEATGAPFLALELVRGCDLRRLCRAALRTGGRPGGYLPDRVSVHVACAVLRALAAAQRAVPGLVHRDVSPSNVLVSEEGEIKLADFGIAVDPAEADARWSGRAKGKVGYVAPEHLRGHPIDARADLFAIGVMLYELVAGRRPWRASSDVEVLRAIGAGDLDPIAEVRSDLDVGLKTAIARLLEQDPRDRYACADDVLRVLAPYSAGDLGSLRLAAIVRAVGNASMENEETEKTDDDARTTPRL